MSYHAAERRADVTRNTPAELAIREAARQVEALGAHVLLTEAVNHLWKAHAALADWTDQAAAGGAP